MHRYSLKLTSVLIALVLAYQPIDVEAQCAVASTNQTTVSSSRHVTKHLSAGPYLCAKIMSMSAMCFPHHGLTVTFLHANARTTAATPTCVWRCVGCGTFYASNIITADGSDGLPVELLEFSIEKEPPQEP